MALVHHCQVRSLHLGARTGAIVLLALGEHNGWYDETYPVNGELWKAHGREEISLILTGDELLVLAQPGIKPTAIEAVVAQLQTIARIAPHLRLAPSPVPVHAA